jgi:hypothetical protein
MDQEVGDATTELMKDDDIPDFIRCHTLSHAYTVCKKTINTYKFTCTDRHVRHAS